LPGFEFSLLYYPQDLLMEAGLELDGGGLFRRKPEVIDDVSPGNVSRLSRWCRNSPLLPFLAFFPFFLLSFSHRPSFASLDFDDVIF
jgi:hypothetical protein